MCRCWVVYSCTINLSPFNPVSFTTIQPPFSRKHATISVLLVAYDKWRTECTWRPQCKKDLWSCTGFTEWLLYTRRGKKKILGFYKSVDRFRRNLMCPTSVQQIHRSPTLYLLLSWTVHIDYRPQYLSNIDYRVSIHILIDICLQMPNTRNVIQDFDMNTNFNNV